MYELIVNPRRNYLYAIVKGRLLEVDASGSQPRRSEARGAEVSWQLSRIRRRAHNGYELVVVR